MESSAESNPAGASLPVSDPMAVIGIAELETAVRRLLEDHTDLRTRAETAEARARALQDALRATSGEPDAVAITDRMAVLEHENTELRHRLTEANTLVRRIAARIQLAEDEI
jgi:hypothetical protein